MREHGKLLATLVGLLAVLTGSPRDPKITGEAQAGAFALLRVSPQSRVVERARLGAQVTVVIYRAPGRKALPNPEPVRLAQTFESLDAELTYMRKTLGLERVAPVHLRSIGLLPGERFHDGVFVGEDVPGEDAPMERLAHRVVERMVEMVSVSRAEALLNLALIHRGRPILQVERVEVGHFETILLEGSLSEEPGEPSALLMTVTVVVLPLAQLRNRPAELSAPCDEYGRAIPLQPGDVFLPPVLIQRVVPRFPSRRPLGSVLVEGIVTPEGRITNARVVRALDRELEAFALEAFQRFRFLPARLNGAPVRATLREEVMFHAVP
jgi:TonB family protein